MTKTAKNILLLLSIFCIASCTTPKNQVSEKITPEFDPLVGKVAAVYLEKKYLLVQQYTNFNLQDEVVFYSTDADKQALHLQFTGQKLGQFWVADLVNGTPSVGDPVYMRHLTPNTNEPPSFKP